MALRPFGYFVHHQGRGHAVRCAALAWALPPERPLVIFCARDDIFPPLPPQARIVTIPSLFEPNGEEVAMDQVATPSTLHCAPLGWPGIRQAMAIIAAWFGSAHPELMICDVSAEIAQLSRICSVPHVKVLQHGDRDDAGHRAAYDGAAGLLAPFHRCLAQPEWAGDMLAKTCFAGGLGADVAMPDRAVARRRLGFAPDEQIILVVSGGGGSGHLTSAALGVGARGLPEARWLTIGEIARDWHATEPANLDHRGWVDAADDHIAAADLVISSTGNTTCQQVLSAAKPWIVVPEWRYFDEQHRKAQALAAAGVATVLPHLPSSARAWHAALSDAFDSHDPAKQRSLIESEPAAKAAAWLGTLSSRLWRRHETRPTA